MTNDLLQRLEAAVRAAERRLTDARELLWHVEGEAEAFRGVVERQKATVGHLREAVEAGRAVLAQATRLAGAVEHTVAAQEAEAAPILAELVHAIATAAQQHQDAPPAASPTATDTETKTENTVADPDATAAVPSASSEEAINDTD
jgi:hypothetical protein